MRKHPYECESCDNKIISKFEYENLLGMCVACYTECCEQTIVDIFRPILRGVAWNYIKLMREHEALAWEDLDGLEDRSDKELVEILCDNYMNKYSDKA